jgi:hypothetical protein
MRVLVCGDRNWTNTVPIIQRLSKLPPDTVIIEGEERGADTLAAGVAVHLGFQVEGYPAQWNKYGRAAGPIRNTQMLEEGKPDLVIAFHNNLSNSKGTKNMVEQVQKKGLPVEIIRG